MINTIQKSNDIKHFIISLAFLMMLNVPAFAGSGHDHAHEPISQEKAAELAAKNLEVLVKKNKIDKSWSGKPVNSIEQKTFSKGPEWVVIFKNEELADASKHTLYMFYSLDGHYLATNHTGN